MTFALSLTQILAHAFVLALTMPLALVLALNCAPDEVRMLP